MTDWICYPILNNENLPYNWNISVNEAIVEVLRMCDIIKLCQNYVWTVAVDGSIIKYFLQCFLILLFFFTSIACYKLCSITLLSNKRQFLRNLGGTTPSFQLSGLCHTSPLPHHPAATENNRVHKRPLILDYGFIV